MENASSASISYPAYLARPVVVQVREGDLVLRTDGAADDQLVDVVELIPILRVDDEISS